ncbi:MAG: histidine phosphatase family protein [Capsulimonadaceae bacterium]
MLRILLIRHAETEWNLEERVQGHADSPLTARGRTQALALAERLAHMPIDAIYASDMRRVIDTLKPAADRLNLPITSTSALREKCFGEWEGLTRVDLEREYPHLWRRYHTLRDITTPIPGGETWDEVARRTVNFLRDVVRNHAPGETVVLAGHGGSLRPLMLDALQAPLTCLIRLSVDNTGISTLLYRSPDNGRVVSLNDCTHIAADMAVTNEAGYSQDPLPSPPDGVALRR